jgi:uncharacterized membrane protein SirB2
MISAKVYIINVFISLNKKAIAKKKKKSFIYFIYNIIKLNFILKLRLLRGYSYFNI